MSIGNLWTANNTGFSIALTATQNSATFLTGAQAVLCGVAGNTGMVVYVTNTSSAQLNTAGSGAGVWVPPNTNILLPVPSIAFGPVIPTIYLFFATAGGTGNTGWFTPGYGSQFGG
jgi:hypothetical protein